MQGGVGRGDREGLVLGSEGPSNTNRTFEASQRGYKVICVWSVEASPELRTHVLQSCESIVYWATLEQGSTLEATCVAVKKAVGDLQLSAVIVGGESGHSAGVQQAVH